MRRAALVALWAFAAGLATPYVLERLAARQGDQLHRRDLALVLPIEGRLHP